MIGMKRLLLRRMHLNQGCKELSLPFSNFVSTGWSVEQASWRFALELLCMRPFCISLLSPKKNPKENYTCSPDLSSFGYLIGIFSSARPPVSAHRLAMSRCHRS